MEENLILVHFMKILNENEIKKMNAFNEAGRFDEGKSVSSSLSKC